MSDFSLLKKSAPSVHTISLPPSESLIGTSHQNSSRANANHNLYERGQIFLSDNLYERATIDIQQSQ